MGLPENATKAAVSTVDALRSVPLAIALLVVNVGFLAFSGYVLGEVSKNASQRDKAEMDLISTLATAVRDCRPGAN